MSDVAVLAALPVQAVELMKWERIPLSVPLHVGQERIILLIATSGRRAAGTERQTEDSECGWCSVPAAGSPVSVNPAGASGCGKRHHYPAGYQCGEKGYAGAGASGVWGQRTEAGREKSTAGASQPLPPLPVALIRYAAQTLYAPLRTVEALPV